MAKWLLLNTIKFKNGQGGDVLLTSGKTIDDTIYSLAQIRAAGGSFVSANDAAASLYAPIAGTRKKQGQASELIDAMMLAAAAMGATASNRVRTTGAAGATVAAAAAICTAVTFTPQFSGKLLVRAWASFAALGAGVVTPIVQQGSTTVLAFAQSSGTGGPINFHGEVELTGLTLGTPVTINFVTTAGDATVTLGHGATGIAAALEVTERS